VTSPLSFCCLIDSCLWEFFFWGGLNRKQHKPSNKSIPKNQTPRSEYKQCREGIIAQTNRKETIRSNQTNALELRHKTVARAAESTSPFMQTKRRHSFSTQSRSQIRSAVGLFVVDWLGRLRLCGRSGNTSRGGHCFGLGGEALIARAAAGLIVVD